MLKKIICLLSAALFVVVTAVSSSAVSIPDVSARSAVLYCKETGQVIAEKDSRKIMSMASTTKIMTSVIALETDKPDMIVEITQEMVNVEGTSSGLRTGDKITLTDLVYCMLLESGNDAANAVAVALSGSLEEFARLMNKKAAEIGMADTSFVTPSGLDDKNHYTTAYDMALLTSYALDNDDFVEICSQTSYVTEFIDSDKQITLYNHNRLLREYEGCIGVKTGFTKKSGRCLVSAAKRGDVTLVAVTLNAGDDWNDHRKMLDYGFSCVDSEKIDAEMSSVMIPVVGSEIVSVRVSSISADIPYIKNEENSFTKEIFLEKFLYAPVNAGDIVGYVRFYNNGRFIKQMSLTAAEAADASVKEKINLWDRIIGFFDRW